mgnify:CR=1 FL=1
MVFYAEIEHLLVDVKQSRLGFAGYAFISIDEHLPPRFYFSPQLFEFGDNFVFFRILVFVFKLINWGPVVTLLTKIVWSHKYLFATDELLG